MIVISLAAAEEGLLSLREWDALGSCTVVMFEDPQHPLRGRLERAGITTSGVEAQKILDADDPSLGLVVEPGSARLIELAHAGASISSGPGVAPDALTAAYGSKIGRSSGSALSAFAQVMARLRGPEGCPWDREQTHESLEVHLQEEAHEVIDAIDRGLVGDELEEELGDVLLQVAFHAQLAADDGRFDLAGVAHRVTSKLVHRHPHVFADTQVADSDEVTKNWESLKAEEKQRSSLFDDIPPTLPSLLMAYKVQKRAASRGFTADAHKAASEVAAALQGPVDAGSLGDALFWLVASARAAGIDPEGALRHAILRFKDSL